MPWSQMIKMRKRRSQIFIGENKENELFKRRVADFDEKHGEMFLRLLIIKNIVDYGKV